MAENGSQIPPGRVDADMFDVSGSVRSIADAIRNYRWLVVLTTLSALVLLTWYIYAFPPIFSASALMMIERDTDSARDSFYTGWNVFRKDDGRTEIEMMTAGPVLFEVIRQQKLTFDDVYHPFLQHAAYLWEQSAVGQVYRRIKRQFVTSESDSMTPEEIALNRTISGLRAGISIEPVLDTNAGRLTVLGPSRRVSDIANALMNVYIAKRSERYGQEAEKSYEILSDEVRKAKDQLDEVERRRVAFVTAEGVAFDFQKESLQVQQLEKTEEAIVSGKSRIATLEASLREIDRQLRGEPATLVTSKMFEHNAVREATKLKRLDVQTALIQARTHYREDSPEVRELVSSLAKLDEMIAEQSEKVEKSTTEGLNQTQQELVGRRTTASADLEGAKAGLAVLEESAAALRMRLIRVPELQTSLKAMDREYAMKQEIYTQLVGRQASAALSVTTAKAAVSSMRVVEEAGPPGQKSWPQPQLLYPVTLLLSLIAGSAGALVLSYTNGRVRRDHVDRGRGGVPLYGTIGVQPRRSVLKVLRSKRG